jgi:inhibitor of cysteine peptidase
MKQLVILALVLLFLAACGAAEPGAIDLTAGNNGETIDASRNQVLNIKLDSNITTGYKWNLVGEPNAAIVKFVSSKYNEPIGGGIGAGGSETWQFMTTGTGMETIKLAYFRPFEPNKQPAREFSVIIRVQ